MTLKKAIKVLSDHNKWRRDTSDAQSTIMTNPTDLGIAIDVIIKYFKYK